MVRNCSGKAQVVAHRQTQPPQRSIGDDITMAWRNGGRFGIAFRAADHLHIEQMDLVVTGDRPAVIVVQQAGGIDPALIADHPQGNGAANQPQPMAISLFGQERLDRPIALRLADGQLALFLAIHQGEILRQHCQLRALVGGLRQQLGGDGQIVGDAGASLPSE